MKIVLLGTFDCSKPRTRILRASLRDIDPDCTEIGFDVWHGVGDKSTLSGCGARLTIAARMVVAYPLLMARYLMCGRHDLVVIGYMGLFDVLLLGPLVKLRGKRLVWDAFLSLYDTYARDRAMARESGVIARALRLAERVATRSADRVVMDTKAHSQLMARLHDIPAHKGDAVLVGAEPDAFGAGESPCNRPKSRERLKALFYGQCIPLHGLSTIVEAALSERGQRFDWVIIGTGQEAAAIDAQLNAAAAPHIERIEWIAYEKLQDIIADADITLGIFGTSEKAASVIPNKVYQALLCGKPIVTQASPAMTELIGEGAPGIYLSKAGDASSLLDALDAFASERGTLPEVLHVDLCEAFALARLTEEWRRVLTSTLKSEAIPSRKRGVHAL